MRKALLADAQINDTEKQKLTEHLLIPELSDSKQTAWKETFKSQLPATQFVQIADAYAAINREYDNYQGEGSKATAKATAFSHYLDGVDLPAEQRTEIANTFKYYNMNPANAKAYQYSMLTGKNEIANRGALEKSDVDIDTYLRIKDYKKNQTGNVKEKTIAYMREMGLSATQIQAAKKMFGWKK